MQSFKSIKSTISKEEKKSAKIYRKHDKKCLCLIGGNSIYLVMKSYICDKNQIVKMRKQEELRTAEIHFSFTQKRKAFIFR